jgi:hypothetical protein
MLRPYAEESCGGDAMQKHAQQYGQHHDTEQALVGPAMPKLWTTNADGCDAVGTRPT